jgi:Neuroendocrine-specific golgi protein P55 (NESP55)
MTADPIEPDPIVESIAEPEIEPETEPQTEPQTEPESEPNDANPRRWDAVTNQWAVLRAGARMVRRAPGHAVEDPHAERVAAAGMGLLVLLGAIVTYVAVVGGIDPLLAQSPAGGAPAAVVPSITPTPTTEPTVTTSASASPVPEPTPTRARSRPAARPPETSTPVVPGPTATPTPTPTSPTPTPTPSPFR